VWDTDAAAEVTDRFRSALEVRDLAGLQGVPAARLLEVQLRVTQEITADRARRREGSSMGLPFGPVVDGEVLPRSPLEAIADGSSAEVHLLTGTTREEWKLSGLMLRPVEDQATILRRLGRVLDDPSRIVAAYRQVADGVSHDEVWSQIMTDRVFRIPANRLAEAQVNHQPEHTFMYQFDFASTAFDGMLGACHALEIPFVFDNLHKPSVDLFTGPEPPTGLAGAMHRAWISFARGGDPNHDGLPPWPAYDLAARSTMHFDRESEVRHDPGAERRVVWDGVL
jgi:para-nitrobenzyl esterase